MTEGSNKMNVFLSKALRYAANGWFIFPLAPGQKIPITKHGVKDATTDGDTIRAWWAKWPNANIAVACGQASGIYVIDVDISELGKVNGIKSLKEFPALPITVRQDTPRGGFHAFFKTNDPPANRNSFRPGIDIRGNGYYVVLAPSIHPNGGTYRWGAGLSPWEHEIAEYPDFLRPATRPVWSKQPVTFKGVPIVYEPNLGEHTNELYITGLTSESANILKRASLYLAQCDPAIQGQAGHDKLLYAASRLVQGFLLSDDQAYSLLASEYNHRCVPPWDLGVPAEEKDFRRKITEARKLQPKNQPGWLLNDDQIAHGGGTAEVDIEKILSKQVPTCSLSDHDVQRLTVLEASGQPESPKAVPSVRNDEMSFLCSPTGLLGDICSWINSTALKPQPFLTLACSLAFLGSLFGRKVKDELGGRTNIYCMGVADSSSGKSHAMNQIRRLSCAAGCNDLLGGDSVASDSGLEERMCNEPSTVFLWDEIGHFLANAKAGLNKNLIQVIPALMRLYSSAGSVYKGREFALSDKQRVIAQPCCCIYGTSTPDRFIGGVSKSELRDGWLSRCLVFWSPHAPSKIRGIKEQDVPNEIRDKVNAWYRREIETETDGHSINQFVGSYGGALPPKQIVATTSSAAEKMFVEFDAQAGEYGATSQDSKYHSSKYLWAKGEENARRIALIIAAGENFDAIQITESIADYACRLVGYLLTSFATEIVPEIVDCEVEKNKRKLFRIIKQTGNAGCMRREVTRSSQELDMMQRNRALDDMLEADLIVSELSGTRKTTMYWTVENYLEHLKQGTK